jgi:choline dehydrogenase
VDPSGRATTDGALDVKDVTPFLHPMRASWLSAARELNLPVTDDFNGPNPEGLGCYQVTIRDGKRVSAADAFLRPALRRPNVKLETHAWVSRIRFCEGRAEGVDWWRDGQQQYSPAAKEVILCGGSVNSPQILQLSGIGPAATLSAQGIAPLVDNAAVGGNLQDHLAVVYSFKATRPTLNNELHSALGKLRNGLRYLLTRTGPLALSVNQFGGFLRADPAATRPDVQLYFNPVTYGAGDATRTKIEVDPFPGFYLCFQPSRPTSVGRIDIAEPGFPSGAVNCAELSLHREGRARCGPRRPPPAGHRSHTSHTFPDLRTADARFDPPGRRRLGRRFPRPRGHRLPPREHLPHGA